MTAEHGLAQDAL